MKVWNSHTRVLYLSIPVLQKPHRKCAETRREGVRYKWWREHTWEESFISSQVGSQGQFKRSAAGGWAFNLLQQHTWQLWPQAHQSQVRPLTMPPSTTTHWKYSNQADRCTGAPLIHRLIWGVFPMPMLYLNLIHEKSPELGACCRNA